MQYCKDETARMRGAIDAGTSVAMKLCDDGKYRFCSKAADVRSFDLVGCAGGLRFA